MPVSSKEPLFVELSTSEEAAVQGGSIPTLLVQAIREGRDHLNRLLKNPVVRIWLGLPGNGFILGDNKRTTRDDMRHGDVGMDIPGNARHGVRSNGRWFTF